MIDVGLLIGVVLAVGIPVLLAPRWALGERGATEGFLDVVLGPLLVGLIVGRLSAVLIDDPGSITHITDLLIIRSGVEFWPGAVAAAAMLAIGEMRAGRPAAARLASVAPLALVGVAGFEGSCVVRSGCFGPASPVGLRPPGVLTTMLPIGWLMAVGLVLGAVALQRRRSGRDPWHTVVAATLVVATVRSIGSFWLPHVGDGLSRPHQTSIVAAVLAAFSAVILRWRFGVGRDGDAELMTAE